MTNSKSGVSNVDWILKGMMSLAFTVLLSLSAWNMYTTSDLQQREAVLEKTTYTIEAAMEFQLVIREELAEIKSRIPSDSPPRWFLERVETNTREISELKENFIQYEKQREKTASKIDDINRKIDELNEKIDNNSER